MGETHDWKNVHWIILVLDTEEKCVNAGNKVVLASHITFIRGVGREKVDRSELSECGVPYM